MFSAPKAGAEYIGNRLHEEDGQGLVEYALILIFVSVVAVTVIMFLGPHVSSQIRTIADSL